MANLGALRRLIRRPAKKIGSFIVQQLITNPLEAESGAVAPLRLVEEGLIHASFPIDIVYTWVDYDDPEFQSSLAHFRGGKTNRNTMSSARFKSHDELKYSLRSIEQYAPWYNRIFIVTNGQVPSWLAEHERVSTITHDQILDKKYLPTFNSHVIGSALHNIPGLSEHYIYFNDDVMLLRPVNRSEAFSDGGLNYAFVGNVLLGNGAPLPHETATEWGGKNARELIYRKWGYSFSRRFGHMYHTQRKSVAAECERYFPEAYHECRQNRFRAMNDILCCSFLHHYVGYVSGKTLITNNRGHFVRVRTNEAVQKYAQLLAERNSPDGRSVVCLNDYMPNDGGAANYQEKLLEFLEAYYPAPSEFEMNGTPGGAPLKPSRQQLAMSS